MSRTRQSLSDAINCRNEVRPARLRALAPAARTMSPHNSRSPGPPKTSQRQDATRRETSRATAANRSGGQRWPGRIRRRDSTQGSTASRPARPWSCPAVALRRLCGLVPPRRRQPGPSEGPVRRMRPGPRPGGGSGGPGGRTAAARVAAWLRRGGGLPNAPFVHGNAARRPSDRAGEKPTAPGTGKPDPLRDSRKPGLDGGARRIGQDQGQVERKGAADLARDRPRRPALRRTS